MKYNFTEKASLIQRYRSGIPVAMLCAETGIARSTLYSWIKTNNIIITSNSREITIQDYNGAKRHAEKLEHMMEILRRVNCGVTSPLSERLMAIETLYGQQYSVTELCEALNVPRGTFYNHILRNKRDNTENARRREELKPLVKEIFDSAHQVYGGAKIAAVLKERGYCVSKKFVLSIMHELGIQSICPQSKHDYRNWEKGKNRNILKQQFHADAPNKIWASDITVFKFREHYYYICVIIDLFSRKIIAYRISDRNSTQLVSSTFKQARKDRKPASGLLFHSDRGCQYLSRSFSKLLTENGVEQSLSRPGKPHDNAVCEAFFAILKKEELYRHEYRSVADMMRSIDRYMTFFNNERLHTVLQYRTPSEVERCYYEACK